MVPSNRGCTQSAPQAIRAEGGGMNGSGMSRSMRDHDRPWIAQIPWDKHLNADTYPSQCRCRACVQWGQPVALAGARHRRWRGCPRTCGQHPRRGRTRVSVSTVVQFSGGNSSRASQLVDGTPPSCPHGTSGPALCIGHLDRQLMGDGLVREHSPSGLRRARFSTAIFSTETATMLTSTGPGRCW